MQFMNRAHAGQVLAERLRHYAGRPDVVVLALPRGGVPVGFEVAVALEAPLDVFIVRKLGVPFAPEIAMGAIASGGVRVLTDVVWQMGIDAPAIERVERRETLELIRREKAYRGEEPPIDLRGKTVIVVDDGLATGATMKAAIIALRRKEPARVVIGVPVSSPDTCEDFASRVDEIVCAVTPEPFTAVGLWYRDFSQTTDAEVHALLRRARQIRAAWRAGSHPRSPP